MSGQPCKCGRMVTPSGACIQCVLDVADCTCRKVEAGAVADPFKVTLPAAVGKLADRPVWRGGQGGTEPPYMAPWPDSPNGHGPAAQISANDAGWEDPLPLASKAADLPPFPVDALPGWMASMVRAVAKFYDTPPDVAAFAALGVVSVATARRAWINAKGQREAVNFYGLTALDSGQRKSGPFTLMATGPLIAATTVLQDDENARAQRAEEDPRQVRLFTTDATPAGLRDLAAVNDQRLGFLSPEGGMFEELAGRYSGIPDLGLVLAGWNGEPYCADRATKFIPPMHDPVLTISLTVQPSVLKDLAGKPAFRERGLLARLLYGLPPDVVGNRKNERHAVPETVGREYSEAMRDLLISLHGWSRMEWHLSDDAYDLFHAAEMRVEPKLARGAEYGGNDGMREWASKYTAHILKATGLLHAAEHVNPAFSAHGGKYDPPRRIEAATMQNALRLGEYFLAHAEATFGLMRADPNTENAKEVLAWIERIDWNAEPFSRHPGEVTRREVCKYVRAVQGDLYTAHVALRILENHGYLRITEGIRGSVRCFLHAKCRQVSALRQNETVVPGQGATDVPTNGVGTLSAGVGTTADLPTPADVVPTAVSAHPRLSPSAETTENPRSADSADRIGDPGADGDSESWVREPPGDLNHDLESAPEDWPEGSVGAAVNPPARQQPRHQSRAQRHGKGGRQ
jgi:replicative DNA helicase